MSGARSVDVRFLRQLLACSWRSLSTCHTTTAVALSLYTRARSTRSSFRWSLLVVFSRFASLFRDAVIHLSKHRSYRCFRDCVSPVGYARILGSAVCVLCTSYSVHCTYISFVFPSESPVLCSELLYSIFRSLSVSLCTHT